MSSSCYCLPYDLYFLFRKKWLLNHLIIPWLIFLCILITWLLDIALILHWYCKNSVLVIHGSLRVKQSLKQTFRHSASQSIRLTIYVYLSHGPSSYNFLNTYLIGTIWHNNNKLRVTFLNLPLSSPKQKYINHNI